MKFKEATLLFCAFAAVGASAAVLENGKVRV
jgi:hypothetical protein